MSVWFGFAPCGCCSCGAVGADEMQARERAGEYDARIRFEQRDPATVRFGCEHEPQWGGVGGVR